MHVLAFGAPEAFVCKGHNRLDQAKPYDFRNVAGQASLLKWSKSAGQVCDWDNYAGGLIALELH